MIYTRLPAIDPAVKPDQDINELREILEEFDRDMLSRAPRKIEPIDITFIEFDDSI